MATRLALGTTDGYDATVTNALKGSWSVSTAVPSPMYLDKTAAPDDVWAPFQFGGGVGVGNLFTHQVYPLAVATDIGGTLQICLPAYASFAPEQDPHFKCHAWIGVGKTSTVRGTLLNNYVEAAGATNTLDTTQLARSFIAPQRLTTVSAQAGDYLHVEIGYVYHVSPGTAACYYEVGPKNAGGTVLPDYTTDQLAYSGGAWQGASWLELEAASSRNNLLTGSTHTVQGSNNLIAGVDGTVTGDRNALFALCAESPAPSITADGTFKVCADVIDLDATTVTVNGVPLVSALDDLSDVALGSPITDGDVLTYVSGAWTNEAPTTSGGVHTVGITIDGGGTTITTGVKGFIRVPWTGTITRATLLSTDAAVTSGSIVIDVWKDVFANYPPTNADSITASAPPTLTSATSAEDATLTGWTTAVTAGDVVGFNVDSVTTLTRVTLVLEVTS